MNADPPVDPISGEKDPLLEDPEPLDYPAIDFLRQQLAELRPRIEELEAALEDARASMRGLEGVVETERWSRRRAEDELKKERARSQKLEKQIARADRDKARMAENAAKELQSRENELAKSHEAKLNASQTEHRGQVKLLELKLAELRPRIEELEAALEDARASMRGLEGVVETERWSRRRAEDELKKERARSQKLEKQIARADRDKARMAEKAAKELESRENELAKSHEAKLDASHTELRSQVKLLELKLQNLTEELHDKDREIRDLQRKHYQPLVDRQVPEIILDEDGDEIIRLDDPDVSDQLYDLRKELEFERRAHGATEAELDRVRDRAHRLETEYKRLKEALPNQPKRRRW
jgi:chromosome segregation ATPase